MDTTDHDLKLLSIGYYVQGGIATFYGLAMAGYVMFLGAMFTLAQKNARSEAQIQMPAEVLKIILAVVIVLGLVTFCLGLCLLYCGLALRRRQHRMLILVMAGFNCLAIPYGTLLGIFTFMVLQRPAAREMFAAR